MDSTPVTGSTPARYVKSLDGIRAVCILAVMGHHFGWCDQGWIGVEIFFVLSGFLITTLLCQEHQKTGEIAIGRFWMRRATRLLPGYWLYIGIVTLAILLRQPGDWSDNGQWNPGMFIASLWGYFVNLAPGKLWIRQFSTCHLWSLALEEQFYFCWPLLCMAILRTRRPYVLPMLVAVFAMGARMASLPAPYAWWVSYVPVGMIVGCAIALLFHSTRDGALQRVCVSRVGRLVLTLICVGAMLALELRTRAEGYHALRPWAQRWLVPLYVWPCALLVASLWYGTAGLIGRVLSIRPLSYIGKISYGMYLYHIVLMVAVKQGAAWLESHLGIHLRFAVVAGAYIAGVIAVASISYYLLERPFLRMRVAFHAPRRAVDATDFEALGLQLARSAQA